MPAVPPVAITTAGGGFKAMTIGMGFLRAFFEQGILSETTHFGVISGASWMQAQFSFSETFMGAVTGMDTTNRSIEEVVTDWGTSYTQEMDKLVNEAKLEDWTFTIGDVSKLCLADKITIDNETLTEFWEQFLNTFEYDSMFPASNWFYYVGGVLQSGGGLTDPKVMLWNSTRNGWPSGTLVVGMSLAPNVWDFDGGTTASLDNIAVDILPLGFAAKEGSVGEWELYGGLPDPLQVSSGSRNNKVTVDLSLDPELSSLNTVTAGSSSAWGLCGSPTLMKNTVSNIVDGMNVSAAESISLKSAIDTCLPFGLQNTSAPAVGNVPSSTTPWSPKYRFIDGGYTDSTTVGQTLSRMQRDCINYPDVYDCSNRITIYQLFNGARGQFLTVPRLFANCDCPLHSANIGTSYSPQLFAEDYPSDDDPGWTLYSNKTYDFPPPWGVAADQESWVWRGPLTTIDNPEWGITAGTTVNFICFFNAWPPQEKVIWPGYGATYAFSTIYGVVAQEQYETGNHILAEWNAESGTPTSRSTTPSPTPSRYPSVTPAPITAEPTEAPGDATSPAAATVVSNSVVIVTVIGVFVMMSF